MQTRAKMAHLQSGAHHLGSVAAVDMAECVSGSPFIVVVGGRSEDRMSVAFDIARCWLEAHDARFEEGAAVCCSPALASSTGRTNYYAHMPCARMHAGFDECVMRDIARQQKREKACGQMRARLLLVDGLAHTKDFFRTAAMAIIAKNFRHHRVLVIVVAVQHAPCNVPRAIRDCVDYCFCLPDPDEGNHECNWRLFFSQVPTLADFDAVFGAVACVQAAGPGAVVMPCLVSDARATLRAHALAASGGALHWKKYVRWYGGERRRARL